MDKTIAYLSLAICLGRVPALSVVNASNVLLAARDIEIKCGYATCRNDTQICKEDTYCSCRPHFEDFGSQDCLPCPSEGQLCRGCCISEALVCYRNVCQRCAVDTNGNCINQETLFFLTAAQVALATAMVLGVISLSFLLYKTLRNRLSRRNNQVLQNETRQSVASRVSLSSIQQRVVRRLRDRPPKYETRHNYEYQQRQADHQNNQRNVPTASVGQENVPVGGPPPAYEGDTLSLAENPPPYTQEQPGEPGAGVAVIEMSSGSDSGQTLDIVVPNRRESPTLQGITNQMFEADKLDPRSMQSGSIENNVRPKECIDIPLRDNGDKTVYM